MMQKRKWIGVLWILAALLAAVGFTFSLSTFAKAVPWSWEKKLGGTFQEKTCSLNPIEEQARSKLLKRLYPLLKNDDDFSIDVEFIQSGTVNAFATLGGKIYVHSELMKFVDTPEELAGVIAHEIEHVRNRHIMENVLVKLLTVQGLKLILTGDMDSAEWATQFMQMHFTKSEEAQADREGIKRLQEGKVNLHGMYNFFEKMNNKSTLTPLFSDHPSDQSRQLMVKPYLDSPSAEILNSDEWLALKNVCR